VWARRHSGLTWLLLAHVPALFGYGVLRGYRPGAAAGEVAVLLLPAGVALASRVGREVRSASTSLGLVIAASVLVHFAGGAIEAHFHFFVIIAFLTLYQAWPPFLLALVYVVVEHRLAGALDPHAVYDHPGDVVHPWRWAAVHGGFVLAASFANVISWRLTEQEALRDGLTGLPNRTSLLDTLDKALGGRDRAGTAVLFLDLDNFKDANDAYGHDTGDALLVALAQRLQRLLRPCDVLARLGGDEFAVVLRDQELLSRDAEGAAAVDTVAAVGERLLAAAEAPTRIGGLTLIAGASIGWARAETHSSAAELLRNADLAMYEAKRSGGGRVTAYDPGLHRAAVRRIELEAELRVALAEGQFVVHYQPVADLPTGRMTGTEALVRWQHPTRGLLPPAEFITATEQSGLIIPLGAWVLRTACAQTASWQQTQPDQAPLTVAVNLAARQILDRTLVTEVTAALHDSGLDPSSLCLEITEGSVISDLPAVLPTLHALRAAGISLALDDFGTGYSSLSYLQQLPVDSVKIDRSFVADLDLVAPKKQIVLAIIELAHALGLSVTAEGAETWNQLALLSQMRSDKVQGYLLGRPVPADEIARLIARGGPLATRPGDSVPVACALSA